MKKNTIILILICIFIAMLPNVVNAYFIQRSYGFRPYPTTIYGHTDFSDETTNAIHNSCLAWNNASEVGDLIYRSTAKHSTDQFPCKNGRNEITKGYRGTNKYIMKHNMTVGNASVSNEGDIDINISLPIGTGYTSYDTQTNLTHEIGHLLGLGHSENSAAIMAEGISKGEIKGIIYDDMVGLNLIYNK